MDQVGYDSIYKWLLGVDKDPVEQHVGKIGTSNSINTLPYINIIPSSFLNQGMASTKPASTVFIARSVICSIGITQASTNLTESNQMILRAYTDSKRFRAMVPPTSFKAAGLIQSQGAKTKTSGVSGRDSLQLWKA